MTKLASLLGEFDVDTLLGDPPSDVPADQPPHNGGLDLNRITGGGGDGDDVYRGHHRPCYQFIYIIPGAGVVPLWRRKCLKELLSCCLFQFQQQWEPCQEYLEMWMLGVTSTANSEMAFMVPGGVSGWEHKSISELRQRHSPELSVVTLKMKLPPSPWELCPNIHVPGRARNDSWGVRTVPLSQLPLDDHWPPKMGTRIPFTPSSTGRGKLPGLNLTDKEWEWEGDWRPGAGAVVNAATIGMQAGAFYTGVYEDMGVIPR
jgi:hypothetical protein